LLGYSVGYRNYAAHGTFHYFKLCSICLKECPGRNKPQPNLEINTTTTTIEISTTVYQSLTELSSIELNEDFKLERVRIFILDKSSLHIIESDLDVRDHCHGG
jgi:hypothetical protein